MTKTLGCVNEKFMSPPVFVTKFRCIFWVNRAFIYYLKNYKNDTDKLNEIWEDMELDGLKNVVSRYHISGKLFYG